MLHGTQQDNMKYVVDMLDRIESKKNLIVAPGCDMPYNVRWKMRSASPRRCCALRKRAE
jgi:hypothetical protein